MFRVAVEVLFPIYQYRLGIQSFEILENSPADCGFSFALADTEDIDYVNCLVSVEEVGNRVAQLSHGEISADGHVLRLSLYGRECTDYRQVEQFLCRGSIVGFSVELVQQYDYSANEDKGQYEGKHHIYFFLGLFGIHCNCRRGEDFECG